MLFSTLITAAAYGITINPDLNTIKKKECQQIKTELYYMGQNLNKGLSIMRLNAVAHPAYTGYALLQRTFYAVCAQKPVTITSLKGQLVAIKQLSAKLKTQMESRIAQQAQQGQHAPQTTGHSGHSGHTGHSGHSDSHVAKPKSVKPAASVSHAPAVGH